MSKIDRASLKIQSIFRMHKARKVFKEDIKEYRMKSKMIIIIQCGWRCHIARMTVKKRKKDFEDIKKIEVYILIIIIEKKKI